MPFLGMYHLLDTFQKLLLHAGLHGRPISVFSSARKRIQGTQVCYNLCRNVYVYVRVHAEAVASLQSFKNDPQLQHLPHTVIASWYQRRGYVTAMADLIQQSLQQFQEQVHFPAEPVFMLAP